jgi:lipopolysaccharide export system protein LptC
MKFLFDDSYSFFITWIKTLLPIAALGMLSTIFLFSGKVDVTQSLPYAELNVEDIIREQRITKPYFTGISESGIEFALSAAYATPNASQPSILDVSELRVEFKTPQGNTAEITAGLGVMNAGTKSAKISQGVRLASKLNFWITTETLDIDFNDSYASTNGPFKGVFSLGSIESGNMVLKMIAGDQQILFTNRVRMLYNPKANQSR